jgi:predicted membrane chloride channel (bestrophin family)
MDDYVQEPNPSLEKLAALGIAFALALRNKLTRSPIRGELRLIVSCSRALDVSPPNTCAVRLHRLRAGKSWLADDIESYDQGVLTIDWLNNGADISLGVGEQ